MRVPRVLIALIAMTSSPVMAEMLPDAPNFHEGMAVVELDGRMGYIDKMKEGAVVINIHMIKRKARQEMAKGGGSALLFRKD